MDTERLTREEWRSEHARENAAKRRAVTVVCPVCQEKTTGVGRRRFCSESCRQKHWRAAVKARKLAEALGVEARELMGPSR